MQGKYENVEAYDRIKLCISFLLRHFIQPNNYTGSEWLPTMIDVPIKIDLLQSNKKILYS